MPQRWAPAATPQQIRYMAPANRASAKGLMMATAVGGAAGLSSASFATRDASRNTSRKGRMRQHDADERPADSTFVRPAVDQVGPDEADDDAALNQFPHDRHRCGPASKQRRHTDFAVPPVLVEGMCLHWNYPLLDPSDDLVKLDAVFDQIEDHFFRVLVQLLNVISPEAIAASHQ